MSKFAPNVIKEKLLQTGNGHGAMLLDVLYSSGVADWNTYGIDSIMGQIAELGWKVGEYIIRKGLSQLSALGLLAKKVVMLRKKGRPSTEYRLASLEGMADKLGVKMHLNEAYDEVDPSAFQSLTDYRAGLHRTFIKRKPGKYSRKWLGARLGVTRRTTANYEKNTDIRVEQIIEKEILDLSDVKRLPKKHNPSRFFLLVEYERPLTKEEKDIHFSWVAPEERYFWNATKTESICLPYVGYLLRRELARGRKVYRARQTTNHYS